ncbi:hypothetical protein [Sphingosinicella terrae]|uniref:hypothetical protein n=1 Tax=Sphingosinicella terrae TaxID=2172047 RepID=UPI000E0DEBAD|nr:hypothetical protein [Sphingosinicella terrae]
MADCRRPNKREQGFVLVTAMWLLILCGAVAALLLARSLVTATSAAGEAEDLRSDLALEAAVETVAADLVINGNRSPFASVPIEREVRIGDVPVRVRIGSESGKLDLNAAELELVGRVLAGLGWEAAPRTAFVQALRARREERTPLRSMDEARLLAARSRSGDRPDCLESYFTVYSGRAEPEPAFVTPDLAALLGRPGTPPGPPASLSPGAPISIQASAQGGRSLSVVMRTGGLLAQPLIVSDWRIGTSCST